MLRVKIKNNYCYHMLKTKEKKVFSQAVSKLFKHFSITNEFDFIYYFLCLPINLLALNII